MSMTVVLHLLDEDPVLGDVEELPSSNDTFIKLSNPRRLDGNELGSLRGDVVEVLWPVHRITFIELLPTEEEAIIGFVRE